MTKEIYLTSEGFLKLEEELDELKKVKRPEIINEKIDISGLNLQKIFVKLTDGEGSMWI